MEFVLGDVADHGATQAINGRFLIFGSFRACHALQSGAHQIDESRGRPVFHTCMDAGDPLLAARPNDLKRRNILARFDAAIASFGSTNIDRMLHLRDMKNSRNGVQIAEWHSWGGEATRHSPSPSYGSMSSEMALPYLLRRTLRRLEEQTAPNDPALQDLKSSIVRSIAELEVQREEPLLRRAS